METFFQENIFEFSDTVADEYRDNPLVGDFFMRNTQPLAQHIM